MQSRSWPTAAEIADDIRGALEAGDDISAMRALMDGTDRLARAITPDNFGEALAQPATIGDARWDALLTGSLRYRLHQAGHRHLPGWTWKPPLDRFWWPAAHSPSKAYSDQAHTPAELMRLGIFLDDREFTTP